MRAQNLWKPQIFPLLFTSGKQIESRESKAKAFYAKFVSRFSEKSLHRFSFSFRDEIESSRECIFTFHLCRHRQHMWMWGSCCKREGNLKTNFRKLESQKHSFDSLNLSHYLWMAGWAGVCVFCKVLGSLYGFSADADSRFENTHFAVSYASDCVCQKLHHRHTNFHLALRHENPLPV